MTTVGTLCYIIKDGKILLIKKKQGLGKGRWNGPGGKIEEGESIEYAASREVLEEICIVPDNPRKVGEIEFYIEGKDEIDWIVHIFVAEDYDGIEKETKEAAPRWFPINRLPYDEMWPDDRVWMPIMLEGKSFKGKVYFDKESRSIINHHVEVL